MSLLKINIVANFAGSMWQALMGLLFIPLYIKFMGIESWGLIGFFATLQVIVGLLDIGLSSTLNREMARLSVLPHKEQEMRNLVRTLEVLYWIIATFVCMIIVSLSSFISTHWIVAGQLSPSIVKRTLLLMGLVMALQMPIGFYSGGLMGLQKQVLLNVINVCMSTLRSAGVVLILWLISPTIQAYFQWQVIINIINTFLLGLFLWRRLPPGEKKPVFQTNLLYGIWRFAAGMSGITILSVILTQLDKIVLSKMLPLETFGYYTLASVIAMSLGRIVGPVFSGIYPRLTQLFSLNDQEGLKSLYHKSCQFISLIILPVAIVVAAFSYEILLLWTQNPAIAERSHILVSLLICGTALNCLMHLPYALQLAAGWTKIGFNICLFLIILFVPSIIILTRSYGPIGAAIAWLALNLIYIAIGIPLTHRRLLKGESKSLFFDIIYPLASILAIVFLGRYVFINFISPKDTLVAIVMIFTCALFGAALSSKYIRGIIEVKLR